MHILEVFNSILIPSVLCFVILFLMIFEQILNVVAEITMFADREFYSDWWNSTGFEEFSRKWNRPVHLFLYKYIY